MKISDKRYADRIGPIITKPNLGSDTVPAKEVIIKTLYPPDMTYEQALEAYRVLTEEIENLVNYEND